MSSVPHKKESNLCFCPEKIFGQNKARDVTMGQLQGIFANHDKMFGFS